MSLSDTLKDKKKIIILVAVVAALVVVLVITFVPFGGQVPAPGPQVISQKAKITLPDETAKQTATTVEPAKPAATAKTDVRPSTPDASKVVEKPQSSPEKPKAPPSVKAPTPTSMPQPKPSETKPSKVAKADARPIKAAKYTGKSWVVNTASFTTKDEAKGFAKALKLVGYKSYVTEFTKDDTQWFRVRAGFFSTQADAEKAAVEIKTQFKIDTPWTVKPAKKELAKYAK